MLTLQLHSPVDLSDFPELKKVDERTYLIEETKIFRLYTSLEALESEEERVRKLKGALRKTLDQWGCWIFMPDGYTLNSLMKEGRTFSLPHARYFRQVWKDAERRLTYIDVLDGDGRSLLEFQMPSGATPAYHLQQKLEAEGDVGWVFEDNDPSSWSALDHLFSHGH